MISSSAFTRSDVERGVSRAIEKLRKHDMYLLARGVNERSITHHLAIYLQREFQGWDVDVEYNRDGHGPKRLFVSSDVPSDDTNARTVYPDIIVHRRGTNNENLLVIEVKKNDGDHEFDERKLVEFTKPVTNNGLGYQWGVHLILLAGEGEEAPLRWYRRGEPCD